VKRGLSDPLVPVAIDRLDAWGLVVREIAARQAGTISRRQLLNAGLSATQIRHALRTGRLHRLHRGVYSLLPLTALATLARHHAALLACGPNAVLSHDTAAHLLGLTDPPSLMGDVHVTTTADRRHTTLIVHRTRTLPRSDTRKVGRLWVTSIPRTVKDLARTLEDRPFERLVDEALARVSATRLTAIPRAAALLSDGDDRPSSLTWSQDEEKLRRLIGKAGLPQPESNVPLGRYVPDLLWREERVIAEYDSYRYHSGPAAFHSDRDRHNHFESLGYRVIHVTRRQLSRQREQVLVWIAGALAQSEWRRP
jgi:very-short-patch-repair endonuclease